MSLNNIQLKDIVVSELYRNHLLASERREDTASSATPAETAPVARPVTPPPVETSPAIRPSPTPAPADARPPSATPVVPKDPVPVPPTGLKDPAPPTPERYKFLGNNRRKISIIVRSPGIAFLPDDQLNVLTRMLEACRMNIGDVAIVNHAASPVVIGLLKQQLQPAFVLLFGPAPPDIGLPMNFPVFKIQAYDQCTYLTAPSLEELVRPGDEAKLLKSKLWVCLKTLFEI